MQRRLTTHEGKVSQGPAGDSARHKRPVAKTPEFARDRPESPPVTYAKATFVALASLLLGTLSALFVVLALSVGALIIDDLVHHPIEGETNWGLGMGLVLVDFVLLMLLIPLLTFFSWYLLKKLKRSPRISRVDS